MKSWQNILIGFVLHQLSRITLSTSLIKEKFCLFHRILFVFWVIILRAPARPYISLKTKNSLPSCWMEYFTINANYLGIKQSSNLYSTVSTDNIVFLEVLNGLRNRRRTLVVTYQIMLLLRIMSVMSFFCFEFRRVDFTSSLFSTRFAESLTACLDNKL